MAKRGVFHKGKAQVSLEYLLILGMSLAVLIPASYLFYDYSRGSNEKVIRGQMDSIGQTILAQAKTMYSLGKNNRVTLEINIPSAVKNITIYDGVELVMVYESKQGLQEAVYFSNVNITGAYDIANNPCPAFCQDSKWSIKENVAGSTDLQIESWGNYVLLNQTN